MRINQSQQTAAAIQDDTAGNRTVSLKAGALTPHSRWMQSYGYGCSLARRHLALSRPLLYFTLLYHDSIVKVESVGPELNRATRRVQCSAYSTVQYSTILKHN